MLRIVKVAPVEMLLIALTASLATLLILQLFYAVLAALMAISQILLLAPVFLVINLAPLASHHLLIVTPALLSTFHLPHSQLPVRIAMRPAMNALEQATLIVKPVQSIIIQSTYFPPPV